MMSFDVTVDVTNRVNRFLGRRSPAGRRDYHLRNTLEAAAAARRRLPGIFVSVSRSEDRVRRATARR